MGKYEEKVSPVVGDDDDFYANHDLPRPSPLFDLMTDTFYFAKDCDGHYVHANRLLFDHFQLSHPHGIIGKTDYDFYRFDIADQMRQDDLSVMRDNLTISNKLELVQDYKGNIHWFITSKTALYGKSGYVVGVEGFIRDANRAQSDLEPFNIFRDCIHYLQQNYMNNISIEALAKMSHMSLSTFERRFKKQFGITPNQYVKRLRIHKACELLIAGYSIQQVTCSCGFCDQSYFTREFRIAMGTTPRKYQQQSLRLSAADTFN